MPPFCWLYFTAQLVQRLKINTSMSKPSVFYQVAYNVIGKKQPNKKNHQITHSRKTLHFIWIFNLNICSIKKKEANKAQTYHTVLPFLQLLCKGLSVCYCILAPL